MSNQQTQVAETPGKEMTNVTDSFDWTRLSSDPNNADAKRIAGELLQRVRQLHLDVEDLEYIEQRCHGKRVLDVGVAAHADRYIDKDNWRHGRIVKVARYCLGIDILERLVARLASEGYNVRFADATSDIDLGERFDLVFVGDVIEHVDNAVALLRFCARHLSPGGSILALTPNPFSRKFIRQLQRQDGVVTNLDHVSWITQTNALELARRSGLRLTAVHFVKQMNPIKRAFKRFYWSWKIEAVEYTFPVYIYEFAPVPDSSAKT